MIPFEGLLPYGIILGFFGVAGAGVSTVRAWSNEGKRYRFTMDSWDEHLMERDFRLTGTQRGQSDKPIAPEAFKVNSFIKLDKELPF